MNRRTHTQRGAALILTLVAIAIVAALLAGVGTMVLGHYSRARTDQDAARAQEYAEAALNFQVQKIRVNIGKTQVKYNGTNATSATYGADPGQDNTGAKMPVSVTVGSNTYPALNTGDSCVCWVNASPLNLNGNDLYLYGEATINGVKRTVRAVAGADNLFNKWALFANNTATIGGSLDITPNSTYPSSTGSLGIIGSNTAISISGSANVGAQVVYNGASPDPDFTAVDGGRKVNLTPITDLANQTAKDAGLTPNTNGIANFATNNDNSARGTYTQGGGGGTQKPLPANGNVSSGDYPLTLRGKAGGANFYLTSIDGSNIIIKADITAGPVNLWINHTTSTPANKVDDKLSGQTEFSAYRTVGGVAQPSTLNDAKDFTVYYNNPFGKMQFVGGGSVTMYAMFYAYNTTSTGTPYGTVDFTGSATVNGSFIANTITKSGGNFTINFPTNISNVNSGNIYFGVRKAWQEFDPVRGNGS